MAITDKFNYKTIDELRQAALLLGVELNLQEDLSPLAAPVKVGPFTAPNSLMIHPMEGFDADEQGGPTELTFRRYRRFARGGAGLIWFEACAVVPEGRTNPHMLFLHKGNLPQFRELVQTVRREAADSMGAGHRPLIILQLSHSGRYSKPKGAREPLVAFHDPLLDPPCGVAPADNPLSDTALEQLEDRFAEAANLALQAGVDGIDIKACHRYLASELLAGFTREGRYGGNFENRSRFLLQTVQKTCLFLKGEAFNAVRLNLYDGLPHPFGWGVNRQDCSRPDLSEPVKLAGLLKENGVSLISTSAGNPYYNPHLTRPFERPLPGAGKAPEHPLTGVARLFTLVRQLQQAYPGLPVAGSGYSWLRGFMGQAAAANLAAGAVTFAGGGRMAFAYPDFVRDLLTKGRLDPRRVCITCSKCTQMMRGGAAAGCPIRDRELYGPIYNTIAGKD